jgi:hypothetical protein
MNKDRIQKEIDKVVIAKSVELKRVEDNLLKQMAELNQEGQDRCTHALDPKYGPCNADVCNR